MQQICYSLVVKLFQVLVEPRIQICLKRILLIMKGKQIKEYANQLESSDIRQDEYIIVLKASPCCDWGRVSSYHAGHRLFQFTLFTIRKKKYKKFPKVDMKIMPTQRDLSGWKCLRLKSMIKAAMKTGKVSMIRSTRATMKRVRELTIEAYHKKFNFFVV